MLKYHSKSALENFRNFIQAGLEMKIQPIKDCLVLGLNLQKGL